MSYKRSEIINLFRDSNLEENHKLHPILSIESTEERKKFLTDLKDYGILDDEYGLKDTPDKKYISYKLIKTTLPGSEYDLYFLNDELDFLDKFRTNEPNKPYYIKSLDFYSESGKSKENIIFFKYRSLLILLGEIVESIADDVAKGTINTYSVFYKSTIKIENKLVSSEIDNNPTYTEKNFFIDEVKLNKNRDILSILINDVNRLQNNNSDYKINIEFLKKSIYDQFEGKIKNKETIYFYEIIEKLEQIYDDYELIKRAYIDSLNPDKLKEDFQKKYQEALTYLNSILTDIHTKTLFIPIAIILSILPKLINHSSEFSIKVCGHVLSDNILLLILGTVILLTIFYFMFGYRKIIKNIGLLIQNLNNEVNENKDNTCFYDKIKEQHKNIKGLFDTVQNRLYFSYALIFIGILFLLFVFIN
jgi:hypothetical protein